MFAVVIVIVLLGAGAFLVRQFLNGDLADPLSDDWRWPR